LAALQKSLQQRDVLAMDFSQERYLALRNKTRQSRGHALFAKPAKFRWSLDAPKQEEWIYDGASLFYHLPQEKKVTRYSAKAGEFRQLQEIVAAVLDFGELLRRYEVAEAKRAVVEGSEQVVLTLRPKTAIDIRAIEIHVSEKVAAITFLKLFIGDDYNAIRFSPPKSEVPAVDAFAPPKGVRVKDM
jgi:outer membrane lipoprotein-sorting protein